MKILFPSDGGVSVIFPSAELPIHEVALKDVPAGMPFRIVSDEDLPDDWLTAEGWAFDFSSPDGVGLGQAAWLERLRTLEAVPAGK